MKKIKISFLMIFVSLSSFASEVVSQFSRLQQNINAKIVEYERSADIDAMSKGDLRQNLFTLETLAKIFSQYHPELSAVEMATKGLEDEIGAYRKTIELLEYARGNGATNEKIEQLTKLNQLGKERLKDYMKTSGWGQSINGQSGKIKQILEKIAWGTEQEEKNNVYNLMAKQLTAWSQTPWNMDVLEGGFGIHDLRKEVRWYKLEMTALSNIIGTHNTSCGKEAITPKDPQSGGKCLVSSCLNSKMLQAYDFLGQIKDEGESLEGLGKTLGQDKYKQVKSFYKELRAEQTLEKLALEIKSCIDDTERGVK